MIDARYIEAWIVDDSARLACVTYRMRRLARFALLFVSRLIAAAYSKANKELNV
jgi:hypothetical protein